MDLAQLGDFYLMPVNALSLAIAAKACITAKITLLDNNEICDGHSFRGVDVVSPKLHDIPASSTVIVCSFLSRKAITYQLQKAGVSRVLQYEDVLIESDYDELAEAFKSITAEELRRISPQHVSLIEVGAQRINNARRAIHSKTVINNVNLAVTLRCTLSCRDCSALIPYFSKWGGGAEDFNTAEVCGGLRRLSELVDNIVVCTILGGEPFLHKDIGTIAEYAVSLNNIESVVINTNGTVLPSDEICEQLRCLSKLNVIVSDYGVLSRKKTELMEQLHNHDVKIAFLENLTWYDFCKIVYAENRTPEEIEETYNICSMMCAGVVKNLFSKCYPALLLELLKAVPPDAYGEKSLIDLTTATRQDIEKHLNSDVPMQACAVCSGKSRLAKQIPPAVQTAEPLIYKRYETDSII